MTEAFSFYRNLLEERKAELMKELDSVYGTRQITLSVVTQRVKETLDKMYQTVEFGDRLLPHASPEQVLDFKKQLETRLQSLLAAVPEPTLAMAAAAAGDLEFVANYSAMQVKSCFLITDFQELEIDFMKCFFVFPDCCS